MEELMLEVLRGMVKEKATDLIGGVIRLRFDGCKVQLIRIEGNMVSSAIIGWGQDTQATKYLSVGEVKKLLPKKPKKDEEPAVFSIESLSCAELTDGIEELEAKFNQRFKELVGSGVVCQVSYERFVG
jgi:hypothetical protein